METLTYLRIAQISMVLFVIGLMFLYFGKFKTAWHDITGFAAIIIAYFMLLYIALQV